METPTSVPEVVAWIGLDWADQRHEIRLAAAGSAGIESFTVEQKPAALHAWVGGLRARFPEGQIAVAERREFYDRHRRLSTQEREDLFRQIDQAQPLTRDQALVQASALMAQGLAEQLHTVIAVIGRLESELERLFAQHPDHDLFEGLPGAGEALAPRLATAFGSDRDRYESPEDIQKFSGIAPVTEKSGKTKWVHWRMACPKFVRQTFHEFAAASCKKSLWARACYEQQRKRGADHHAAVRALAYKWIRILYRCWKDRTPYDEQIYLKSLKRHRSPLWLAVMSLSTQETHG